MKNGRMIATRITLSIYWQLVYEYVKPYLNIKFFISFFTAWMITNGWSYIFVIVGSSLKIKWMATVGASYQGFLWLPCTPEKLVTIPIAIFFHKILFPHDFENLSNFDKLLAKEKRK